MISRDPPQMGIPMSVGVETGIPLLAPPVQQVVCVTKHDIRVTIRI